LCGRADAVRRGDGRKIDGKRVIVDRELGRTKTSWFPRRLGGGKGEVRRDRRDEELIREIEMQFEREQKAQARKEKSEGKAGNGEDENKTEATPAEKPLTKQEIPVGEQAIETSRHVQNPDQAESSGRPDRDREDRRGGNNHRSSKRRSKSRSRSPPSDRNPVGRERDRGYTSHHRDRDYRRERESSYRDYERRGYGDSKRTAASSRAYRHDRDQSFEDRGRGEASGRAYDHSSKPSFYVSGGDPKRELLVKDPLQERKREEQVKVVEEREDGEL